MTRESATNLARGVGAGLLMLPAPLALEWLLLMLGGHAGANGYPALLAWMLPFAVASAGLVLLKASWKVKLVIGVFFFPALFLIVTGFGLGYVCAAYGDCV